MQISAQQQPVPANNNASASNGKSAAAVLPHSGSSASIMRRPAPARTLSENSAGSAGTTGTARRVPRQLSKQSSAESKTAVAPPPLPAHKKLHPAERQKRAVIMAKGSDPNLDGFKKSPYAMNAFRRLSRAEFPFNRAGDNMTSIKKIMEKFERHSTIHGICHASLAPNKRWRRFWLGVFTVCFVILVSQVVYLVLKYLQYPKTVDIDLKFENAPFPSVTVCNLNPYKASAIGTDESARATMNAFQNILQETGRTEGVAAAIASSSAVGRRRRELLRRAKKQKDFERRYLQVYAQCYCEINRLSAERKKGSCFAAYKGKVSLAFGEDSQLHNFHPTKCLCQLDWITKTLWPCFPYNTWKEHVCTECVDQLGHCPMRFPSYTTVDINGNRKKIPKNGRVNATLLSNGNSVVNGAKRGAGGKSAVGQVKNLDEDLDVCVCHKEYNHCVQNNLNGDIPELLPSSDLEALNFTQQFVDTPGGKGAGRWGGGGTTTTTTTQAPEVAQAMGFEELKDEIAIKSQARENLMFAVEAKPREDRVKLSQPKEELILKCSFNQYDCDIKKDFILYYDPTYGNCFTFNWDRQAQVTAHRAGANYGLRMLLYANVSEYLPTSEAVGFRITVHDKWTVPFADAFGYNAPTGFMSSFGVRMKKFFRLEPPYGHCSEGGENSETYIYKGYSYSIEGCHRSCTQNEVIRICGCADPLYPVPQHAQSCKVSDPVARDCIKNTSRHLGDLIAQGLLENCKCHQPCRETAYEVTYSAARWPSGTTKLMECESNDALCMEKYRTNAAMIQVFYEELNYETLSESVAYSLNSLFADLGGVIGLWIGISVVSILEVVQLIWFCLDFYRNKKKRENLSMRQQRSVTPSSGSTSLYKTPNKKTSSGGASNPSLGGRSNRSLKSLKSLKGSVPSDIVPPVSVVIQEESDNSLSSSSVSTRESKGSAGKYLAPGDDLPCTCLYGSRGQIVFMKPLCPFHGYMVRRVSIYSDDGFEMEDEEGEKEVEKSNNEGVEDKDANAVGEVESEEDDVAEAITDEERKALEEEAKRELDKRKGREQQQQRGKGEENG